MAGVQSLHSVPEIGTYHVADLPTVGLNAGTRAWVDDGAATPVYMATTTGGGTVFHGCFWDGSAWKNC